MSTKTMIFTVFAAISATLSASAFAQEANIISCESKAKKISLIYSTTSLTGKPSISFHREGQQILPLTSRDVSLKLKSVDTDMGKLVTATVSPKALADAPSYVYSFFMPEVILGDASEFKFKTVMLTNTVGGYRQLPTALQAINEVIGLNCSASRAVF